MTVYSPAFAEWLHVNATNLGHTILNVESQRYSDGYLSSSYQANWNQQLNAGALAACMWKYADEDSNSPEYRAWAIATVERAFKYSLYQIPGGWWRFTYGLEGTEETTNTSDTINFEVISSIVGIMHYLGDSLDRPTRKRWAGHLSDVLDYYTLGGPGYPWYYINGNYMVHLAGNYWEVANQLRLCGDKAGYDRHYQNYIDCWSVVLTPYPAISLHYGLYEPDGTTPWTLWQGFGLVADGGTQNEDWSNFTAHLSETPTGPIHGSPPTNTWDPAYSMLTLDLMACFFLRSRDFRINRMLNAEHNKLEPLINTTTWVIDANFGSRQSGFRGYNSAWMQIMYLLGGRTLNRTIFTDNNMQNSYLQTINNLTVNIANGQGGPATQRQYHIAVAAAIEAANIANRIVK